MEAKQNRNCLQDSEGFVKNMIKEDIHPAIKTSSVFSQNSSDILKKFKEKLICYQKLKTKFIQYKNEQDLVLRVLRPKYVKMLMYEELEIKWNKLIEVGTNIEEDSTLFFNPSLEKYQKCLKILSEYKMPPIGMYWFNYVLPKDEVLIDFLVHSIPAEQRILLFNAYSNSVVSCKNYFYCLKHVAFKCTERFALHNMMITCLEFCSLIKMCKGVERIELKSCIILTDTECNFDEMKDCIVERLDFGRTADKDYSNWIDKRCRMLNIFRAINKCKRLRYSLNHIEFSFKHFNADGEEFKAIILSRYPLLASIDIKVKSE